MRNLFFMVVVISFSIFGCTDAERQKYNSFGSEHSVKCWSGSTIIFEGTASGKVISEEASDGYYFEDKATGKLTEVSGNCVIVRL